MNMTGGQKVAQRRRVSLALSLLDMVRMTKIKGAALVVGEFRAPTRPTPPTSGPCSYTHTRLSAQLALPALPR